jgi:hypothetical protein
MPSPSSNVYTALRQAFPADLESTAVETESGLFYTWRDLDRGSAMLANFCSRWVCQPMHAFWFRLKSRLKR